METVFLDAQASINKTQLACVLDSSTGLCLLPSRPAYIAPPCRNMLRDPSSRLSPGPISSGLPPPGSDLPVTVKIIGKGAGVVEDDIGFPEWVKEALSAPSPSEKSEKFCAAKVEISKFLAGRKLLQPDEMPSYMRGNTKADLGLPSPTASFGMELIVYGNIRLPNDRWSGEEIYIDVRGKVAVSVVIGSRQYFLGVLPVSGQVIETLSAFLHNGIANILPKEIPYELLEKAKLFGPDELGYSGSSRLRMGDTSLRNNPLLSRNHEITHLRYAEEKSEASFVLKKMEVRQVAPPIASGQEQANEKLRRPRRS